MVQFIGTKDKTIWELDADTFSKLKMYLQEEFDYSIRELKKDIEYNKYNYIEHTMRDCIHVILYKLKKIIIDSDLEYISGYIWESLYCFNLKSRKVKDGKIVEQRLNLVMANIEVILSWWNYRYISGENAKEDSLKSVKIEIT